MTVARLTGSRRVLKAIAALLGLGAYGLGLGWSVGGRRCPGCRRSVQSLAVR